MRKREDSLSGTIESAWRFHHRRWKNNLFVYAVISRRSRGLSIGINLNPDKKCNFNCVYCQVDRQKPAVVWEVDLARLAGELDEILEAEKEGLLYEDPPFNLLRPQERGVRDIAFSGDGEPTLSPYFEASVRIVARARERFRLESAKLVLMTNAAFLHEPAVQAALAILDANNGEIWAKLDAGTDAGFRAINRTDDPLDLILSNILEASRARALVIQSLLFRMHGKLPAREEVEAYCRQLNRMASAGGKFSALQLYTIARAPAEPSVVPLSSEELAEIGTLIRARVGVPVQVFVPERLSKI